MPTLTPFIDYTVRALLMLAVLLVSSACVSPGDRASSAKSSEPDGPSDQMVDGSVSSEALTTSAPPPPEVKGDNAVEFDSAVAFILEGRFQEAEIVLLGITSDRLEAEIAARHPIGLEPSGLKPRRQEQELEA